MILLTALDPEIDLAVFGVKRSCVGIDVTTGQNSLIDLQYQETTKAGF